MCCASHAACDQKVDQLAISVLSALAAAIEAGKDMQSVRVSIRGVLTFAFCMRCPLPFIVMRVLIVAIVHFSVLLGMSMYFMHTFFSILVKEVFIGPSNDAIVFIPLFAQVLAALKAAIDAALGFVLPLCSDFP